MSEQNLTDNVLKLTLGNIVQQFTEEDLQKQMPIFMQDIDADTKDLIDTYQSYLNAGNFKEAELYRASHTELETRIWDAFKANSLLAYASYIYMYAKNKTQQCIISETEPPSGNGEDIIGQVEGDIWFRIDEIKDGIVNTTPFQKQADGTYMEFAVAPKLEFASNEDIDEICNEEIVELTNPESLVNNSSLKYYNGIIVNDLNGMNENLKALNDELSLRIDQCFQLADDGKQSIINALIGAGLTNASASEINSFEDIALLIKGYKLLKQSTSYQVYPRDTNGIVGSWIGSANDTLYNNKAFDATPFNSVSFAVGTEGGSSSNNTNIWYNTVTCKVLSSSGKVLRSQDFTKYNVPMAYTIINLSLAGITENITLQVINLKNRNYPSTCSSITLYS